MSDELRLFLNDLTQEVSARATAHGTYTRTALLENFVERLLEAEELQDWTPSFFEKRGQRRKVLMVDGYCTDELDLDGTLQILIVEPRDQFKVQTLSKAEVTVAFERVITFVTEAIEGRLRGQLEPSTSAADLADLLFTKREQINKINVLLLTNGVLGSRYKAVETRMAADDVECELHVWDLVRFHRLAGSGGREDIDIDVLSLLPGGIAALPAGIGTTEYQAFLCVVPGTFLADLYARMGSRILEGNVRAFLSARGNVNKGIRKTILGPHPEHFFAFNNGITATASHVELCPAGCLTRIVDLQIVNGGQTTASLFTTRLNDKASLDRVFVQMKLSVLSSNLALAMIPDISRFANTQNKVSDADLFANHPFNRRIEDISRRLWAPPRAGSHQQTRWFYERARAQYQTEQLKLSPAKKREFLLQHPKDQVLTKTDLAKYENSFSRLPYMVCLGAQKNFIKYADRICATYDVRPDDFNDRWFQHLVAKALVFSATERVVSSAAWYTGDYRAPIVTYAIAQMVDMVDQEFTGHVLDLDQIWRTQSVSEVVCEQLDYCARTVQAVILNTPREGGNVGEWAKRKDCWDNARTAVVQKCAALRKYLKAASEEVAERRIARGDERDNNLISATIAVMQRARDGFWGRAIEWKNLDSLLTRLERGILETAVAKGPEWIPSDAQAKRLMVAAEKLEQDGMT